MILKYINKAKRAKTTRNHRLILVFDFEVSVIIFIISFMGKAFVQLIMYERINYK